ncbi:MAG: rod shape-determining protein MreD [Chloracidobacterium sp.]|nr:rod shape-determining protein MreD [Chloracidobacterium sp.]
MEGVRLTIALIIAVVLQWTLRNVAEPLAYVDLPLIVVVYAALQRNSIRAIIFGTLAGIAVDALSGGLLGANGFSKTLVAYAVSEIARRVYLDNILLRIPIIAGACLLDDSVYYGLHRLFGQAPAGDVLVTGAYSLIGTTTVGTVIYLMLQSLSGEKGTRRKRRDVFGARRQTRRRNPIRLGK